MDYEEAKRKFQRHQMSHKDTTELQKRVRKAQVQLASLPLEFLSLPLQAMMYSPEAEASPFSGMTKLYRGVTYPQIDKLDRLGRPIDEFDKGVLEKLSSIIGASNRKKGLYNTPLGSTWWTTNPRLVETYMNPTDSVAIPAYLKQPPDEIMDAERRGFSSFFSPEEQTGKDFRKLLRRKNLKSILVKNILDPGPTTPIYFEQMRKEFPRGLMNAFEDRYMADNYLIKDPSILKFIDDFE